MTKAYLEIAEINQLEAATTNLRDRLLIRVLFHLGCRVSEALGLTVESIDFERYLVTILHLKSRLKLSCPGCGAGLGRSHSFCPKCGVKVSESVTKQFKHRRQRVLPLDPQTMLMLKEYIDGGGAVERDGRKLVFGINRNRAWQIVRQCAEKAGLLKLVNPESGRIHNVSPHKLRDAFAVHAVKLNDSGDGLQLLQEHLGHQSFNTTARYRKVSGEESRDWYARLWEDDSP